MELIFALFLSLKVTLALILSAIICLSPFLGAIAFIAGVKAKVSAE